jgi:hypothetical protein
MFISQVIRVDAIFPVTVQVSLPQGSIYVGTETGIPEVPKLPCAWGYSQATRPQRDTLLGLVVHFGGWARG